MAKILIIRGGALGDFILTLPAIELIRTSFPDTHLEILGYPSVTSLAEISGLADATRSMEYGPLSMFFIPDAELPAELIDYFSSFSVVISYLYDPDGYFETNVRKAGVKTYYKAPHKVLEDESPPRPAAAQLATPLEQLALYLEKPFVDFSHLGSPTSEKSAPVFAIHPGSGSPKKNWALESWAATAVQIRKRIPEATFLIISGEAEDRTISDFLALAKSEDLPFRHLSHPSLKELTAELCSASIFLGHDTGVSHLAAACGVPSILLFGPTNPEIWAPQNPKVQIIQAPKGDLSRLTPNAIAACAIEFFHTPN